jgi:hypothetical protein
VGWVEVVERSSDIGPLAAGRIGTGESAAQHRVQPVMQRVSLGSHPDLKCRVDRLEAGEQRVGKALGIEQSRVHLASRGQAQDHIDVGGDLGALQRQVQLAGMKAVEPGSQQRVIQFFDGVA